MSDGTPAVAIHGSLLTDIPAELPEELTEILASAGRVRIERIVSRAHASPPAFWYQQDENEFVLLLQGRAGLRFEDSATVIELAAGDYLVIPAGLRHRVEWTAADVDTVWCAVFY